MTSGLSFRRSEPLFGLDIGHSSLKVMQLEASGKRPKVVGYGSSYRYAVSSIENGVLVDQTALSKALHDLFDNRLMGEITSKKVACTIPSSYSFSRPLKLPVIKDEDIKEAVHLQAEQYIPVSPDKLYIDYEILRKDSQNIDLLVVATPKNIVDSYMSFLASMGLEPAALEPTMNATARAFGLGDPAREAPTVLMDFGANATDIAVYEKTIFVNSTVQGGGSTMIDLIAKQLGISHEEAYTVKNKEGIGYEGQLREIRVAVEPLLTNLVRETHKIMRYYNERMLTHGLEVAQAVITGGGANMPGLSEYLSKELDVPVRLLDPWATIDFGGLPMPPTLERSMFITVTGEAILDTLEVLDD